MVRFQVAAQCTGLQHRSFITHLDRFAMRSVGTNNTDVLGSSRANSRPRGLHILLRFCFSGALRLQRGLASASSKYNSSHHWLFHTTYQDVYRCHVCLVVTSKPQASTTVVDFYLAMTHYFVLFLLQNRLFKILLLLRYDHRITSGDWIK